MVTGIISLLRKYKRNYSIGIKPLMIVIDNILVLFYKYLCGRTKYTCPLISSRPLGSTGPQILVSNTIIPEKGPELLGE